MQILEIIKEFFDESIRVEQLIHIGTMCADEAWSSIAQFAFDDDHESVWNAIGIEPPDDDDNESTFMHLMDHLKTGFLVEFATPVPQKIYSDGSFMFSWSNYTTTWIYDESFEQACQKALEWRRKFIEKKRQATQQPDQTGA